MPEALTDKSLSGKITMIGVADGLLIGKRDGRMYVSSPQDDSIKVRDLAGKTGGLTTLIQDKQLRWPDTFSEGPDGTIYVTTSHIQDSAMYRKDAPVALPTELWRFKPSAPEETGSTNAPPQ